MLFGATKEVLEMNGLSIRTFDLYVGKFMDYALDKQIKPKDFIVRRLIENNSNQILATVNKKKLKPT